MRFQREGQRGGHWQAGKAYKSDTARRARRLAGAVARAAQGGVEAVLTGGRVKVTR